MLISQKKCTFAKRKFSLTTKLNNIARHIEILLLDNDCVIVPGLGGFMAHHVNAVYYADSQAFFPPTRQLGFNAQLKINDSLLAQSYIEAYDISYPEALRRIESEVDELQQIIQNTGRCELNGIGVLRFNDEGNLEFEPCESGILTPNLYGLSTVDIQPLEITKPISTPIAATNNVDEPIKSSEPTIFTETVPLPEPELSVAQTDDEEDSNRTIHIKSIKHIGSIAAAIALLLICSIPFGKMTKPQTSEIHMDSGSLYRILSKEMCFAEKSAEPTETVEMPAIPVEKSAKVVKDIPEKETKHYFSIVLASRVTRVNAEEFVKKLTKAGLNKAKVVNRPDGSVKVIYGNYATQANAQADLSTLRSSTEAFSEGWIMEFDD